MSRPSLQWSRSADIVMALANDEAAKTGSPFVLPEHVLLGILRDGTGAAAAALTKMGLTINDARRGVIESLKTREDAIMTGQLPLHPFAKRAARRASVIARQRAAQEVEPIDILLALCENPRHPTTALLRKLQIQPQSLRLLLQDPRAESVAAQADAGKLEYDREPQRPWYRRLFGH